MPEFLDIKHLDAGYGRSQVLFDVNLGIPWRGGVAVLGRNGAGKTTLMKTIVGELPVWKGEVGFDGRDISRRATQERVRAGIGYVPQEHSVFARLSVRDNLAVGSLASRMLSYSVSDGSTEVIWNFRLMPARARSVGVNAVISVLMKETLPSVGTSAPAMHFISVLLPEPFGPIRP